MAGGNRPDGHVDGHGHVDGQPHIVPVRTYILVFLALLAGTWLTVAAAGQDFGPFNTVVALGIAITKATLVILFFMHVKYSGRLVQVVVIASVGWLVLLMTILGDYYSPRTDGHVPDRPAIVRE
jgi:cytochrome c oxidase subunit IV